MPALRSLAALALILVTPAAVRADEDNAPFSSVPTLLPLCGGPTDNAPIKGELCKTGGYDKLAAELDRAIQAAAAKAPANVRPLLKRDQAFFYDMIAMAGEGMPQSDAGIRRQFDDMLRRRISELAAIADGLGRDGVLGKWVDAFGSITVTAAEDGAYRLTIATDAIYGTEDEHRWQCQASALVKPDAGGWLSGPLLPEEAAAAQNPDTGKLKDAAGKPSQPATIKLRRQGDTLRVVLYEPDDSAYTLTLMPHCANNQQITASYFASGKPDAASTADKQEAAFVRPSFDCARPATASDEEICADPELAENDQRLNRAWKALLPRLDEATRRALTDDQRHWVGAQANQYPLSLHPGPAKLTYGMHYTNSARDDLLRLQRARIALLEGFDENRKGLAGTWLSYTAILTVTVGDDDELQAKGWKWDQLDWKGGCEYDMSGKAKGGMFRAADGGKNPDTLERDHAMLIVNRLDDAFAAKRHGDDGVDEMKCLRSMQASSTARLFPAKPSRDIDEYGTRIH